MLVLLQMTDVLQLQPFTNQDSWMPGSALLFQTVIMSRLLSISEVKFSYLLPLTS
jgi:hypothetical protein